MLSRPVLALAASAAAFLAVGAAISPASAQSTPEAVSISYADLNLASDAGRTAFDNRIAYAARQVCGDYHHTELKWAAMSRTCQAEVIAAAQPSRDALVANQDRYAATRFVVSRAAR